MVRRFSLFRSEQTLGRLTLNERKILKELIKNSRARDMELGQKLGISSQAANKIRKKLERMGIIRGYKTELNGASLMGKVFSLILFDISKGEEQQQRKTVLIESLKEKASYVRKVYITNNSYMALLVFKSAFEMGEYFNFLHQHYSREFELIEIHVLHVSDVIKNCFRDLAHKAVKEFNKESRVIIPMLASYTKVNTTYPKKKLSSNEEKVIENLKDNSRITCREISRNFGKERITDKGIQKILLRLEKKNVIKGYTLNLDYPKMGIKTSALIFLKKRPLCWELDEGLHKWIELTPHITECYRLNGNHIYAMVCYFKSLREMEEYLKDIEVRYNQFIEIEKVHIISSN